MQGAYLEITVISAEALTLSGRPVKKNAFVTLSTDVQSHVSTRVDTDGGSNPRWEEKLHLPLPAPARSLAVEVRCKEGSRVRDVGAASIPQSDFYGGILPLDYLHLLSYRLRDAKGEPNGIINLSIRVHAARTSPQGPPLPPPWAFGGKAGGEVAVMGFPERHMHTKSGRTMGF